MSNNSNNTQVLSKEVSRELMNQVINLVETNFSRYRCTDYDTVIYYPSRSSKLAYNIKIELHYSSIEQDNRLVLKYRTNPENSWITSKFNYSESSIQRLLEQLEYLNVQLRINK